MQIPKKSQNIISNNKTIRNTIRECVQDNKTDPNPTHYSKFDKDIVKDTKSKLVSVYDVRDFQVSIVTRVAYPDRQGQASHREATAVGKVQ